VITTRDLNEAIEAYSNQRIFRAGNEIYIDGNPYRRPVGLEWLGQADFSTPASQEQFLDSRQLVANRILCNAYESSMIILPAQGLATAKADFDLFYGDEVRQLRDMVRPGLERYSY